MKIKEGFVVREIAGQSVVIAVGAASKIFNGIIKLNETGKIIWTKLSEGAGKEDTDLCRGGIRLFLYRDR